MSEFNQRARAKINPLGVGVSFPKPTISQVLNLAVSPLVVGVTLVTPNTTTDTTPLSVAVTLVAPTIVLGVAPSPLTVAATIVTPTVV